MRSLSQAVLTSPSRRWDAPIPFPGKTRANQFFRPDSARVSRGTPVRLGLLSDCTYGERRLPACWFRLLAETNFSASVRLDDLTTSVWSNTRDLAPPLTLNRLRCRYREAAVSIPAAATASR